MKRLFFSILLVAFFVFAANAQPTFTFDDLVNMKRVGDPQLSPDGKKIAYTVGVVDKAANKTLTQIYTMSPDGSDVKQLTNDTKSSSSPRWSPDGKMIAYTTGGQIWTMEDDGDDKEQITKISTGAGNPVWSPDGKMIAFNSDVYPECESDECNKTEDAKAENSKVQAKVTERLLFRHWNEWRDRKRTHVFVVSSNGGVAKQITNGDWDSPPYGAASGVDYAFSPDSKEIAFIRNPDKVEATSTNSDIYIISMSGGNARNITVNNRGYDASPVYTSDGKYILFRSQATEGFEADRWRIMRFNRQTNETVELTRGFDLQVDEMTVSPDGKLIYFTAGERGNAPIFSVPLEPDFRQRIATHVKTVYKYGFNSNLNVTPDGQNFIFIKNSMTSPNEIYSHKVGSESAIMLKPSNTPWALSEPEELEWKGAMNANVHGFLLKPANFDASKKYPLLVLIHGGPQGAWNNNWGYRWNPQIFANRGYIVFMPNPRGSTGYGQKFVNEVSADWGGRAYNDIMNGVAEVLRKHKYIDANRIGAAGGSYGGYMVNWILGHNNDPRAKFKALISHAGIYNLESMAMATEEQWFTDWEFKGLPYQNPVNYKKWSPHLFAKNFKTPTLVIHGELDYRVPIGEGLQLYTALQRQNVPSKLVYFPDEGHWILKPQNSEFWYGQVSDWLDKHLKP